MKNIITFTLLILSTLNLKAQTTNFNTTQNYYNNLISGDKPQTALLNLFFTKMPKGGDLHNHYTGTIYAETFLDWVKQKNWKIDSCTYKINTNNTSDCTLLTVDELIDNDEMFRKLLTLWSDKDYSNHFHNQPPPDLNFFNTFGYFGTVSDQYMATGLQILKQRAINENVQYIETMLSTVKVSSKIITNRESIIAQLRNAKTQKEVNTVLKSIDKTYNNSTAFNKSVSDFILMVDTVSKGIDDDNFKMRFQSYGVRVLDPLTVYTNLLAAFVASSKSPLIVGVNIVAPENNHTALQDYTLHMQMFNYLHSKYPTVNKALHAGELTLGMVRPKNLVFHIDEALNIAGAQRIGHGVDISYENNSIELLKQLKNNAAIEINLTSNEFILGVKNNKHPYLIYKQFGVPMVISTDDSGVSRNNLTNEYVLLATRYKPTYSEVKMYVYNSITYAFLSDALKAELKKQLDTKFVAFEEMVSGFGE